MRDLSIKVSIAGRIYPLTVQEDEEENIRRAIKEIETMVKDYEKKYAVKDKQDLLAMCALQYATDKIGLEHQSVHEDEEITKKIERLSGEVAACL